MTTNDIIGPRCQEFLDKGYEKHWQEIARQGSDELGRKPDKDSQSRDFVWQTGCIPKSRKGSFGSEETIGSYEITKYALFGSDGLDRGKISTFNCDFMKPDGTPWGLNIWPEKLDEHGHVVFFRVPETEFEEEVVEVVEDIVPPNKGPLSSMKLIDLFAGTGAFSSVFNHYGGECVFANDFCTNSESMYNMNHPNKLTYGDLTEIDNKDIPPHDIMCGGFPCQPFSIAGKQEGFGDERSNVFWKILKILHHHSPGIVILENVKNLTSHDKKRTFQVIHDKLSELGYYIHYKILNTAHITGLPQNRERIYIVCFKDKSLYDKFNLEFDEKPVKPLMDCLEKDVDENYYYTDRYKVYDAVKEGVTGSIYDNKIYQYRRYYVRENKSDVCPTLTANMGGGGHNVPLLKDEKGIRRLTPRECFTLQGFPLEYKLPELCDSALYKLAGNAVSLPVVELIVKRISSILD